MAAESQGDLLTTDGEHGAGRAHCLLRDLRVSVVGMGSRVSVVLIDRCFLKAV